MFADDFLNCIQLVIPKTAIACEFHRIKPKLRISAGMRHMNMRRLPVFQAIEEKPKAANSQ